MITVELKNGFKAKIDPSKLDDMYFVEAMAEMETNIVKLSDVCSMLLGEEQKMKMYKSLEEKDGRVPLDSINDAITEIMTKAGDKIKNSSSSPA